MKLRRVVLLLLLLTPLFTVNAQEVVDVDNLSDILDHITAIDISYSSEGDAGHFGYTLEDEETVDGEPTWKIISNFGEVGDEQSYTIWVHQETGRTVKAEIDGQEFTGQFAEVYGNATLGFFTGFIYNYWHAWAYEDLYEMGNMEYGTATPLGSRTETYGPTTLKIWGMRYEGRVPDEQNTQYDVEIWYAPTEFGGVMTFMSLDVTGDEEQHTEIELESIELVNPQTVPSDFEDFLEQEVQEPEEEPEEDPDEDPETEPDEDPETEPEEDPDETQDPPGGIPSFPVYAVLAGMLVFLFYTGRIKN